MGKKDRREGGDYATVEVVCGKIEGEAYVAASGGGNRIRTDRSAVADSQKLANDLNHALFGVSQKSQTIS
jgi:hypothetical protein